VLSIDVLKIVSEQFFESIEISKSHGLDQESTIMGEEEKAARFAHTLTCFENALNISFNFRAQ